MKKGLYFFLFCLPASANLFLNGKPVSYEKKKVNYQIPFCFLYSNA